MTDASDLLAAMPNPSVLLSEDGRITDLNRAAQVLLGAGIAGRNFVTALRQPRAVEAVESALGGEGAIGEWRGSEAGRDTRWELRAEPLPAGGALLSFEDRTGGAEIDQLRRDFVANVSHELKTPLTALMGYIETLRGPAREDAAARERFLGVMEGEARRMSRLVSDLLSLSRVEGEARVRPRGICDLADAARAAARTLRARDGEGEGGGEGGGDRIALRTLAAPVRGDLDQLTQVASNLIENALKYGSKDGTVRVEVGEAGAGALILGPARRLTVADEGAGIAAHHLPRLTERFYRVDSHRSRVEGGTGLGLAIVKHIVARHRGRMRIESAPGRGTSVIVDLPAGPEG